MMSELDSHLSGFFSLELKRTLSLKMQEVGISPDKICAVLAVSTQFVSKWKQKYAKEGLSCLAVQYEGRPSYLSTAHRSEIVSNSQCMNSF